MFAVVTAVSALLAALGLSIRCFGEEQHPVIEEVSPGLAAKDVDSRASYSPIRSEVNRPTLAPLEGFPTDLRGIRGAQFASEFNNGASGVIMAMRSSGPPAATPQFTTFTERWYGIPPEERIFVSFTRADISAANIVRTELEMKGYTAFLYINEPGGRPLFQAGEVGEFFQTAGHHLVIDSPDARRSPSVAYEAYWHKRLPPVKDRRERPKQRKSSDDNDCWECCTKNSLGEILGCYPLGCGKEAQEGLLKCNTRQRFSF